jgi:hypothetical protein
MSCCRVRPHGPAWSPFPILRRRGAPIGPAAPTPSTSCSPARVGSTPATGWTGAARVPGWSRSPAAGGARQHLGVWNPLDDLPSQQAPAARPAPRTPRARLTLRLPDDLVEAARDAVARLAGTPEETTLTTLAERGLRAELGRLADAHNHGRPFPPRRKGRSR